MNTEIIYTAYKAQILIFVVIIMNLSKNILIFLETVALIFLAIVYRSYSIDYADPKGCEMVWMRPAYASLNKLDSSLTRMGNKYSVHLYREGGIDDTKLAPSGIPVLFIPGNAGSYKQGRSLASYCSKRTHEDQLNGNDGYYVPKFDFYLADFNEDLTAFHGRTMLDQAEYINDAIKYILSLYDDSRHPDSVIVIGHSMGGIVARTLVTLPNYVSNSINTIITLATPHSIPPLTFDRDVNSVYDLVNQFWRESFSKKDDDTSDGDWLEINELSDTVLISITGGRSDSLVPSDYTSVLSVVPPSHGFTTFSYSIPKAWTGIDHQAIVWCSQCRRAVANSLFDIIDRHGHVLPYNQRVDQFKRNLLPGFPGERVEYDVDDYGLSMRKQPSVVVKLDPESRQLYESDTVNRVLTQDSNEHLVLPITSGATIFTDAPIDAYKLYLCNSTQQGGKLPVHDYGLRDNDSSSSRQQEIYKCYDATADEISLPASNGSSEYAFMDSENGMKYYSFDKEAGDEYEYMIFVSTHDPDPPYFLSASGQSTHKLVSPQPPPNNFIIPSGVVDVSIESATSSLFSYKVEIKQKDPQQKVQPFAPLIRQYITDPVESVFHVNAEKHPPTVFFHGPTPFVPYDPEVPNNLHLQFFTPPVEDGINNKYEVTIKINWWASLANLVLRYRILAATFPMAVTILAFVLQLSEYNKTGHFHRYQDSLRLIIRQLPIILVLLSVGHFAVSEESVRDFLRNIQIPSEKENMAALKAFNPELKQNDIFLGLTQPGLWFLGPGFFLVSIGLCQFLLHLTQVIMVFIRFITPKHFRATTPSAAFPKRLIMIALMCVCVTTLVPYQFAFVIGTLIQLIHTSLQYTTNHNNKNFYGFSEHLTMLFLLNTFINAPIVIVWFHNLALNSTIHFTTHHNIFSVLPSLLLIENVYTGNMLPQMTRLQWITTKIFLFYSIMYIILYGLLHSFMLHHLVNILSGWLLVVYLDDPGTKQRMGNLMRKRD